MGSSCKKLGCDRERGEQPRLETQRKGLVGGDGSRGREKRGTGTALDRSVHGEASLWVDEFASHSKTWRGFPLPAGPYSGRWDVSSAASERKGGGQGEGLQDVTVGDRGSEGDA